MAFFQSRLKVSFALAALGAIELALCVYGAHAQGRHRITTSYATALAQAAPYLAACWLALRAAPRRSTTLLALGFAAAFRLVALGTEPYLSTDVYRYVWDGRVQGAGINPYRFPPSDPNLTKLRDVEIYPRMNRPDARTIYPPGAEMLFFLVTRFGERVGTMKLAMVGFELLTLWALGKLLVAAGLPAQRLLLYAWHPLPVWEFAGSGHLDAAVIAAVALALLAVRRGWAGAAGVALAGAGLGKLFPIMLFPALYRRWDWRLPAALAGTAAGAYAFYLSVGLRTVFDFLLHGYPAEEGINNGERFYLLALAQRVTGARVPTGGFLVFAGAVLIGLAAWALWAPRRDALSAARRSAALAAAFTGLLSPGYAWYFAWLVLFLPLVPRAALFWMTASSFLLYANWLHTKLEDFFLIHCAIYLPAAALAIGELAAVLARRRALAVSSPDSVPS